MNKDEKEKLDAAKKKATEANQAMNNDRLSRMEAIADAAEEKRTEDEADAGIESPEVKEIEENQEVARALQEEGATVEEPQETDSDEKTVNGEKYYRQIVNGQEVWQTLKQIRETAQKVASADEYLRTASESVRNAARLAPSPTDTPINLEKDEVRKLLAAAALGEEEAIEKLASVIARPSVSPDVLQTIDQRLSFRTELARLEEKSEDLLKDPYMGRLFRSRLNELKQESPTMSLKEAYTSIDKELRGAFPGFKGYRIQEKLERKRALPAPLTTGTRQSQPVQEDDEGSVAADIAEMAKARGQSPHVHRRT